MYISRYIIACTNHKVKILKKRPTSSMSTSKKNNKKGGNPISGSLKDIETRRRQVFKPVLDNPFTQSNVWPFVEPDTSKTILELLSHILSRLGQYNKLIQDSKSGNEIEKKKFVKPDEPDILRHITIGFNSTVKALELQAKRTKDKMVVNKDKKKVEDGVYIKYVLVTKFEISPSLLLQPFPVLSTVASKSKEDKVKLVQLPRGSLKLLSDLLNIPHVTIIGLSDEIEGASALYDIINSNVADVEVPWVEKMIDDGLNAKFTKPVLKVLSTSAPIFPKKNDQKKKKPQDSGKVQKASTDSKKSTEKKK